MRISEQWLRQWVDPSVTTTRLAEQLTMAGFEVEAVEAVEAPFDKVLVAEILTVSPHPNADRLQVCDLDCDGQRFKVVCGATNIYKGMRAPFARVGAVLKTGDKPLEIKKATLRGMVSEGMLCSASELGFEDEVDGIWDLGEAPVGADLGDYLQLQDQVIEISLTPNRGDCLSILGLAREVAAINGLPLRQQPQYPDSPLAIDASIAISSKASQACSRYLGRLIEAIDVSLPTPLWMRETLRRSGIRCHHPVVDITNYVMLELGQPLHAFDADKLQGAIEVRWSLPEEWLKLLDGQEVELQRDTLVIADDRGAIAIAGVMGGMDTAVGESTRRVFIESAFFHPQAIASQGRNYKLASDAAYRYERGVDPQIMRHAINRTTQLLLDNVKGRAGPIVELVTKAHQEAVTKEPIRLERSQVSRLLGCDLAPEVISQWLLSLGLELNVDEEGWVATPPSWRFDLKVAEDLIEEIARLYGYDALPMQSLKVPYDLRAKSAPVVDFGSLRQRLIGRDFQEVISYSFIDRQLSHAFSPEANSISLKNPLSADMSVMRQSLLPGLLHTLGYNLNRQQQRLRLFEIGQCFTWVDSGFETDDYLAALVCGSRYNEYWDGKSPAVDFYDIKGDLEALLKGLDYDFKPANSSHTHPGQSAQLSIEGLCVGSIGALHPQLLRQFDIDRDVLFFELKLNMIEFNKTIVFNRVSAFPEVRRDLAFELDEGIATNTIIKAVLELAPNFLRRVILFDVYRGKELTKNKKSLAMGFIFVHPSRTLNDEDVKQSLEAIIKYLETQYQIEIRH